MNELNYIRSREKKKWDQFVAVGLGCVLLRHTLVCACMCARGRCDEDDGDVCFRDPLQHRSICGRGEGSRLIDDVQMCSCR